MARWIVYYADGSTFSSAQGEPNDAPSSGVIAVVQPSIMQGREILNRWPCYHWADGRWQKATRWGLFDLMLSNRDIEGYLQGAIVGEAEFRAIWERAFGDVDPEIPAKTSRSGWESPWATEPDFMIEAIRENDDSLVGR